MKTAVIFHTFNRFILSAPVRHHDHSFSLCTVNNRNLQGGYAQQPLPAPNSPFLPQQQQQFQVRLYEDDSFSFALQ